MTLDHATRVLRDAPVIPSPGSVLTPRVRISMDAAKELYRATHDETLRTRIEDGDEWNEDFVRIGIEDRERLLAAIREAA